MNFYKHYIGDYARDTAHLTLLEHGAYRVLLDTYYATGKPLPADKAALYRICKAFSAAEKRAVDSVSDQFFPVNGDGSRHNHRADKELEEANAYADAQAMRAHIRWHKQGQSLGSAHHSHSQIPEPENTKTNSKPLARSAKASSLRLGEGQVIEKVPCVGSEVEVCETFVAELRRLYPAVDVPQTLKEIRGWNLANPSRQKTPRGIAKHINGWCAREQNRG